MLRADSGTAYRGAYGKGITSGVEVQRRSSGNFDSPHQQETSSASPAQSSGILLEKAYSGPFMGQSPHSLHRTSTGYTGPYGSGTKLNELDQAAGVHETGTPQLNPTGTDTVPQLSSGSYHGALSKGHPPRHS